jgi:hypothetical protein
MNINIDTTNKTISFGENINMFELFEMIQRLLPDNWKEYTLLSINVTVNYKTVIEKKDYINPWKIYPTYPHYPTNPYSPPYELWCNTENTLLDNNIEINNKVINAYDYYNK